jgi:hypothetical protein
LRDFSLFDDIVTEQYRLKSNDINANDVPIDSALIAMQKELEKSPADSLTAVGDSAGTSTAALPPAIDPHRDGYIVIEDYTPGGNGIARLRAAFSHAGERCVRLAFVGDSYIEGDIFTQDVRAQLQEAYGGSGVGYINMYSEFPCFRRSVVQSGSGWNVSVAGKKGFRIGKCWLSEQYSAPSGTTAKAKYSGTKKIAHAATWSRSTLALWAPNGGEIAMCANGGEWITHDVEASENLQSVAIDSAVTRSIEVSIPAGNDITALGVWLNARSGVAVDCMSSRGFSGVTLRDLSPQVCRQLGCAGIDYDLIVLEFGINAMSASQTDYTSYGKIMTKVLEHVRECYPNSVIMMMGVGDRGQKHGSEVKSMPGTAGMIAAQRDAARQAGCLFWDTREAMGGEGSIITWANATPPRANKDYVHLNHHGGSVLAGEFVKSLQHALTN